MQIDSEILTLCLFASHSPILSARFEDNSVSPANIWADGVGQERGGGNNFATPYKMSKVEGGK